MSILGVNAIRLVTIRSGVARYVENVLRCWASMEHPFERIRVYAPRPIERDAVAGGALEPVVVSGRGPYALWEQLHLPLAHGRRGPLFCPSYVAPLAARCPIALVHHGSYEGHPAAFGRWRRLTTRLAYGLSARRAELVITVSESSRRDMVRFYGLAPERIHVVPEGVDTELFRPLDDAEAAAGFRRRVFGEDTPFLLYVGKPVARHNIRSMLEAYRELLGRGVLAHRFLFVGAALPGIDVSRLVGELGIAERVTLVGHADHEFIRRAYDACACLLYPSEYEGFGMPVLEAMACGCPVIALERTALPEFAGGVAWLAPRGDAATLAAAIERVLGDEPLRRRMRELGPRRAAAYDWRLVARRTMDLVAGISS
ncbi:MAG TPA: glycosyltransferase family 1 protein [Thermoanaerobaculia bacterium]|jgi:glycosyltransferase involved in cell wall biosynthesis